MSMARRRPVLRFFARLSVIYVILVIPWPGIASAYLATTCAVGQRLLGTFGSDGAVTFERHPGKPWVCTQTLYRRGASAAARRDYDSRQDYLATALVVALIGATPLERRRMSVALLLGLALIHAFILWRIWLGLMDAFSDDTLGLIRLSPFWKDSLRLAVQVFVGSIEASFIVPIFIWIVVALRRGDVSRWGVERLTGRQNLTQRRGDRRG
jgi:hypothetical protein